MTDKSTSNSGVIGGHEYSIRAAGPVNPSRKDSPRGKPRFIVKGFNHAKGDSIAFKSLERAERHIRNLGMFREQE